MSALALQSNVRGSNEHFIGSPMIPSASPSCLSHAASTAFDSIASFEAGNEGPFAG